MIDMMRAPLAQGGTVVLLVRHIASIATNSENEGWTDLYMNHSFDPYTIDMGVEAFAEMWIAALCGEVEDFEEINDSDYRSTKVH